MSVMAGTLHQPDFVLELSDFGLEFSGLFPMFLNFCLEFLDLPRQDGILKVHPVGSTGHRIEVV
jgi:hypothetical protein